MEEGVFTLWSIVHFFSGIAFAFMFSLKWINLIKYAGIFVAPFFLINNIPLTIICTTIIFVSVIAWILDYFSKKGKNLSYSESLLCAFSLFTIWEFFEYLTSPITGFGAESFVNKTSDLVIGFGTFLLVFFFLKGKLGKRLSKKLHL
jgi:hypothetical protein